MLQIKEIFKSDLDPNSPNWWAKDKVDKLNFNFNQLEEGGIPGPQGTQGSDGFTGYRGVQGFQGFLGPQGYLGHEGLSGKSTWRQHVVLDNNGDFSRKTLQPNFQGGTEYASIPLVLGAEEGTSEYTSALHWQQTSSLFYSNYGRHNFSLSYKDNKVNFRLKPGANNNDPVNMDFGKLQNLSGTTYGTTTINYDLENYSLNLKYAQTPTGANLIDINYDLFKSTQVLNQFNNFTSVDPEKLHYNVNALEGKVLVSDTSDGDLIWKNKFEVFSALPVGSVISIRESDFNNDLFHISDNDISSGRDSSGLLQVFYGRGRENTMYEGWYLANGQKWKDGVLSFELPNLNSFDFNLTTTSLYEGAEQQVQQANPSPVIIAGGGMELKAEYVLTNPNNPASTDGLYQITHEYDSDDINIQLGNPTGSSDLAIKRNINIINLGETSLYWQTTESTPTATTTIELSHGKNTQALACDAGTQTYRWTGASSNSFTDLNESLSGVSLYTTDSNGAPGPSPVANWYSTGGVVRKWNGSAFTSVEACPVFHNVNLKTDSSLKNLNGVYPLGSSTIFTIDQPLFKDATDLKISGVRPSAGWYREDDATNSYRRYWDGVSQFIGYPIDKNYVYAFNDSRTDLSEYTNSLACDAFNTISTQGYQIYFGRNEDYTNTTFPALNPNLLNVAYNEDDLGDTGVIYVENAWNTAGGSVYEVPLVRAYDQNRPSVQSPFATIVEVNPPGTKTLWAVIKTDSTLVKPALCFGTTNFITGTSSGNSAPPPPSYLYEGTITVGNSPASVELKLNTSGVSTTSLLCSILGGSLQIEEQGTENSVGQLEVFGDDEGGLGGQSSDTLLITNTGVYNYALDISIPPGCSGAIIEFTVT